MQLASEYTVKMAYGAEYDLSQETKVAVQFTNSMDNLTELKETVVIVQLQHQGYAFKLPVYGFIDTDNKRGILMTFGVFALANLITYKLLKYKKSKKPLF